MSEIEIKEYIPDKESWYSIKRFDNINGLGKNFSQKTIDMSNTSKKLIDSLPDFGKKDFIFEQSKQIKEIQKIKDIMASSDDDEIKGFFGWKKWADEKFRVVTSTLHFNPYNSIKKIEDISGFFNYYYAFSGSFLFVPNIRIEKSYLSNDEKQARTKEKIIDVAGYLKFVDETYDFLSTKNKKYIFVPVSLRFSTDDLDLIIDHYMTRGYRHLWFDFEGKPVEATRIAKVIHLSRRLEEKKRLGDIVTYFTNIKREITGHIKDDKNPASDVLASLFGASFIGVNREAQRGGNKDKPLPKIAFESKARAFDDKTYYYTKTQNKDFITKPLNFTNNALILDKEFMNQQKHFLDNSKIQDYLKTKEMLTTFKKGKILSEMHKDLLNKNKKEGLF